MKATLTTFVLVGSFLLQSCSGDLSLDPVDSVEVLENPDLGQEYDIPSKEEVEKAEAEIQSLFPNKDQVIMTAQERAEVLASYSHLDPARVIPKRLLENAVVFFEANKGSFSNKKYISIVDFSANSRHARMYVVDLQTGIVTQNRTSHGVGGDSTHDGFVERLSNVNGSFMSSKGFYRVAEIYSGKYGRSVRLDGLSATNSRARARAIVIHGADYVREANVIQGRSQGCFALSWSLKDSIVSLLAGGSLLYADKL